MCFLLQKYGPIVMITIIRLQKIAYTVMLSSWKRERLFCIVWEESFQRLYEEKEIHWYFLYAEPVFMTAQKYIFAPEALENHS